MATDPYAAPRAHVADVPHRTEEGVFIADGRTVPAGDGWQWIADGWALFRRQPGMWIGIGVVFIVIMAILSAIPVIGSLASFVLAPIFTGGLMLGCRNLDRGGEIGFGDLFAGFQQGAGKLAMIGVFNLVAWVIAFVIGALAVGGGAFALLGGGMAGSTAGAMMGATTILLGVLIVLAIGVPIYMAIWFAPALVALRDVAPVDALKASFFACLKNIVPFLLYGIIVFGLIIVASIPFGLGILVLVPLLIASIYTGYRDIFFEA